MRCSTMSEIDMPALGPCCICGGEERICRIVLLDRRCAVPGHGWGCAICGLPPDGAAAVLCGPCCDLWRAGIAALKTACRGFPASDGRIPIDDLSPEPFVHDAAEHAAEFDDEFPDDDESDLDDYDPGEECGRWSNGRLRRECSKAATEFCDFECPYRD